MPSTPAQQQASSRPVAPEDQRASEVAVDARLPGSRLRAPGLCGQRTPGQAPAPRTTRPRKRATLSKRLGPALRRAGLGFGAAVAFVCVVGYGTYYGLTRLPLLDINEMELVGEHRVGEDEVWRLLALGEGDHPRDRNSLVADMDELERRLEVSPWIKSASVTRMLPDGLEIDIEEEIAVAAVELDGMYLMNSSGELFKRADADELVGLVVITGLSRDDYVSDPKGHQEQLLYAMTALGSYQSESQRPKVGEIHIDEYLGLHLVTYESAIGIYIGQPEEKDLADRFAAFDRAYQALDSEEHAAVRAFRIADRTPSDRVTVAFAGN